MTRASVLQEVRQMRVEARYARRQRRELTMAEAAAMLGVTARTVRRWRDRVCSRRRGGVAGSAARVPVGAGSPGR